MFNHLQSWDWPCLFCYAYRKKSLILEVMLFLGYDKETFSFRYRKAIVSFREQCHLWFSVTRSHNFYHYFTFHANWNLFRQIIETDYSWRWCLMFSFEQTGKGDIWFVTRHNAHLWGGCINLPICTKTFNVINTQHHRLTMFSLRKATYWLIAWESTWSCYVHVHEDNRTKWNWMGICDGLDRCLCILLSVTLGTDPGRME